MSHAGAAKEARTQSANANARVEQEQESTGVEVVEGSERQLSCGSPGSY